MQALNENVEDVLTKSMRPPNFPIEYHHLSSKRELEVLRNGSVLSLGSITESYIFPFKVEVMQAHAPSHPQQGCLYYKVTSTVTNKSVACIWDNESKIGGDQAVIKFAKNCNMMIHDTQYTQEEYISDKMIVQGFGHSTYEMAMENAAQAKVKHLVCIHYNPKHTDDKLDEILKTLNPPESLDVVTLAQEGIQLEL